MAESQITEWMDAAAAVTLISAALSDSTGRRPPVVLIDGRSGAGKTTLAHLVSERIPATQVLRLDDIYPGWNGLEAAREHLYDLVLKPLATARPARWQRWDWETDTAAEWTLVDPAAPLMIEGVGAVSERSAALAHLAVWVELDAEARRERALARDGERFARHWDQWARHEYAFVTRERPRDHVDLIVDGRSVAGPLTVGRSITG